MALHTYMCSKHRLPSSYGIAALRNYPTLVDTLLLAAIRSEWRSRASQTNRRHVGRNAFCSPHLHRQLHRPTAPPPPRYRCFSFAGAPRFGARRVSVNFLSPKIESAKRRPYGNRLSTAVPKRTLVRPVTRVADIGGTLLHTVRT